MREDLRAEFIATCHDQAGDLAQYERTVEQYGIWRPDHWRETVEFWYVAQVPLSVLEDAAVEADRVSERSIRTSRWALYCVIVHRLTVERAIARHIVTCRERALAGSR